MRRLNHIFESNREWAEKIKEEDPQFFERLSNQQSPEYLWIGCADSRVPANQIMNLMPGDVFVHRNVANVVVHTDFNCLSVIQFAVEVLKVKHIMVVGHYGCGGVKAALKDQGLGLINNWLRHIQDVRDQFKPVLQKLPSEQDQIDRLCELNAIEQVRHVCQTTIVQDAWARGQDLSVHAWVYDVADGLLRDLGLCITSSEEREEIYDKAVKGLVERPVRSLSA
ncbi:carbonate dehydratase [Marinobacter halodurans]|uniref:Carbonic anhydrase n=1 Tax=Marinobacter halodurans TaxID=2528979 RepID=A0ABY1ZQ45_9GAMM|nr:carbonate dehydratase [Marinobacter halodurans]TBW56622.1 carbonate dehydratase [Marinobacter halodurans]